MMVASDPTDYLYSHFWQYGGMDTLPLEKIGTNDRMNFKK